MSSRFFLLFSSLLVLMMVAPLAHGTNVTGGNLVNQHWTLAGSPYVIQGDAFVPVGSTLTIDPGVQIQVASNDGLAGGRDSARVELTISGTLIANGTHSDPIVISSSMTSPGAWYGLVFEAENTGSALKHVEIRYAVTGVLLNAPSHSVDLQNLLIERCSQNGIHVLSGEHFVDATIVRLNQVGIHVDTVGALRLTNCLVHGNSSYGLRVSQGASAPAAVEVANCTFHGNSSSNIYLNGAAPGAPGVSILSTISTGAARYGIENVNLTSVNVAFCNLWNNSNGSTIGISPGAGNISYNPFFVSSTDFHISEGSLVIDAGDPASTVLHDLDGAVRPLDGDGLNGPRVDMGAYEYILAPSCGDGVVQTGESCDAGLSNGIYGGPCNAFCTGAGPFCGDGIPDPIEEACDDGNDDDTDACLSDCTAAFCGDGNVQDGVEACDDGNDVDTDACLSDCTAAFCGDGYVQDGVEACDDGNDIFNDGCTPTCELTLCGDSVTDPGEDCDDGNNQDDDACLNTCVNARCGDGLVQFGVEACDDGNLDDDDACRNDCSLPACGDGVLQDGETCDDGNLMEGDGCSAACTLEETPDKPKKDEGWGCSTQPTRRRSLPHGLAFFLMMLVIIRGSSRKDR